MSPGPGMWYIMLGCRCTAWLPTGCFPQVSVYFLSAHAPPLLSFESSRTLLHLLSLYLQCVFCVDVECTRRGISVVVSHWLMVPPTGVPELCCFLYLFILDRDRLKWGERPTAWFHLCRWALGLEPRSLAPVVCV